MFLKRVQINDFKVLKNVDLQFENNFIPSIFPLASLNGGGKSTLLQLIFILLHCSFNEERHDYLKNILSPSSLKSIKTPFELAKFTILHNNEEINLEFIIINNQYENQDFSCFLEVKTLENKQRQNNPSLSSQESQNLQRFTKLKDIITKNLKEQDLLYITHIQDNKDKDILLCKTKTNIQTLEDMANKVYLAALNSQIFLFLKESEKKSIFSKESSSQSDNYWGCINKVQERLKNFFTYDFASTDIIIKSFQKARDEDFQYGLEHDDYGDNLKKLKAAIHNFLRGKMIIVDSKFSRVVFKLAETKEELLPEDLSHGEQKKLGIYLWLKLNQIEDSLVLMDEIEIGLHPDWQYEIVNELQEWSKNNQFILATHSYELCQALTPAHVKELEPKLIK